MPKNPFEVGLHGTPKLSPDEEAAAYQKKVEEHHAYHARVKTIGQTPEESNALYAAWTKLKDEQDGAPTPRREDAEPEPPTLSASMMEKILGGGESAISIMTELEKQTLLDFLDVIAAAKGPGAAAAAGLRQYVDFDMPIALPRHAQQELQRLVTHQL